MRSAPRSPATSTIAAAASAPNSAATRAARSCAGRSKATRPSLSSRNATAGAASARRRTAASAWSASVRGCLRNLRRAGVAKNRSRTTTRVPGAPAAGATSDTSPPSTRISEACAASRGREVMCSRAAAPIEGSASPRNPRVAMCTRSSSASFEVAWRSTASASPSGVHAAAVVGHLDAVDAAVVERDGDARGAGVERVLHQLLHRRGRALDHLAGGDAVDGVRRQDADRGHARGAEVRYFQHGVTRSESRSYTEKIDYALRTKRILFFSV